ncbi:hypothetical protein KY340_02410 [Candidatus Woesearchaeota archaeon]|nr:hypothetical protein [Candidatus Woesearchaeota archaeon]
MVFEKTKLTEFLLKARMKGYAGDAPKIDNPQRPGFIEFAPYKEDDLEYVDSYAGYYFAPGQEVIRFKGKPIWNMSYNGGMKMEFHGDHDFTHKVFLFLGKALQKVSPERPFRGPDKFKDGDFMYIDKSEGDIAQFKGTEIIFFKGKEVFRQDYMGGFIVWKE